MFTKYFVLLVLNILINNAIGEKTCQNVTEIKKMISDELQMELNKLKENIEKRFEKISFVKLEDDLEKKFEGKLEENLRKKLEGNLEESLRKKLEENLRNKLEESLEDSLRKKLEENLRKTLETKLENNLRSKLEDNLGKTFEEKLEEKVNIFESKFEKKQNTSKTEEWVLKSLQDAIELSDRAVVAGYEPDGSPLWIIKGKVKNNNVVSGNLKVLQPNGYFASLDSNYFYYENVTDLTKVLCAPPEKVRWIECRNGVVPRNAVVGGQYNGEKTYIGRAREQGSLTPGWILPSKKTLYIVYNEKKFMHNVYEVLCLV